MIRRFRTIIYFIQGSNGGPIKIGFTENLEVRLSRLQTGCPYELIVLATMEGDKLFERMLHLKFDKYRVRLEWFDPSEELLDFIADIPARADELIAEVKHEFRQERNNRAKQLSAERKAVYEDYKREVKMAKQVWRGLRTDVIIRPTARTQAESN